MPQKDKSKKSETVAPNHLAINKIKSTISEMVVDHTSNRNMLTKRILSTSHWNEIDELLEANSMKIDVHTYLFCYTRFF